MCIIQLSSELCNELLGTYFHEYYYLSDAERKKMNNKFKPKKLFIEGYSYNDWYENVELPDKEKLSDNEELSDIEESVDLSDMLPLEGNKEIKRQKELIILTLNKLLTRLSKLLAKTEVGNNLCKLKNEIRQILHLLYQHIKITEKVYNNLI